MTHLPSGTVTFLFTDIEGSTALAQQYPGALVALLARHHAILHQAIQAHHGIVFQIVGDAFCAAFATAPDAVSAAIDAQRALQHETWTPAPIYVRMGIHTGTAQPDADAAVIWDHSSYATLARAQRVMSTAYGQQILLSNASAELVRGQLPADVSLLDLREHRLKGLQNLEHLWQVVVPDLRQDFSPLQTLNTIPNNLPLQLTSFVGRAQEIQTAQEIAERVRLLTLTGPGGAGKTRLSLALGTVLLAEFENGVFFVALANITDPPLVATAIAKALGVREMMNNPLLDTLKAYLAEKHVLLLLDNFEQVMPAAPLINDLLSTAPRLKVIVTSREVLHLSGEHEFRVSSLTRPDPHHLPPLQELSGFAAIELFLERARAVKSDIQLTPENARAIAEICEHLDGLPLAIELAAARVRLLSPDVILRQLQASRLKLLSGGARDLPMRQQTLRDAIAWSYNLLTEPERILFRRFSVFAGGATLEAIQEVCADKEIGADDILELVSSLMDKSLLLQVVKSGQIRFEWNYFLMMSTIREYARDKLVELGESERMRQRHLDFFCHLAVEAAPHLRGPGLVEWLERLEADHDNLGEALGWSVTNSNRAAQGLRLAAALDIFWWVTTYRAEGLEWFERILALGDALSTQERANALIGAGRFNWSQGNEPRSASLYRESSSLFQELDDSLGMGRALAGMALNAMFGESNFQEAQSRFEQSAVLLRQAGDKWELCLTLGAMVILGVFMGKLEQADSWAKESLVLAHELNNKYAIGNASLYAGTLAESQNHLEQAATYFASSLALFRELHNNIEVSNALNHLSELALIKRDPAQAAELSAQALAVFNEAGSKTSTAWSWDLMGLAALEQGNYDKAEEHFHASMKLYRQVGDTRALAESLAGIGGCALGGVELERAARLFGSSDAIQKSLCTTLGPADSVIYERNLERLRAALAPALFAERWAEGHDWTLEQAIAYALTAHSMG